MSLRSSSNVKESMVLTRTDHLSIHTYISSLLYIIVIPILLFLFYYIGAGYLSQLSHARSYVIAYISDMQCICV